jgi:Antirepressor regulating drug resistance, predicted signal transduction N-terminal membrane component
MLPFNKISLRLPEIKEQAAQTAPQPINTTAIQGTNSSVIPVRTLIPHIAAATATKPSFNYQSVFTITYWITAGIVFSRILYSLGLLVWGFARSERRKYGKFTIIYHPVHGASYSFFKWVFISNDVKDKLEKQNIINHELVHASQYHSIDILAVELLSAVMWFNPFIWLMRRWMQQLHEYLADEGVLQSGADVLEYQALLVNQVAGDGFICLPSGFNQSLIKKRLAMMTKTRINRKTGYKLLALLPITVLMLVIVSFTNKKTEPSVKRFKNAQLIVFEQPKQKPRVLAENPKTSADPVKDTSIKKTGEVIAPPPPPPPTSGFVTAVAPTKMNVLYLGVDNPLSIAVSGVPGDKIVLVTSDNGSISKLGTMYVAKPKQVGMENIQVFAEIDGKKVLTGTMSFRVKHVPDPIPKVAGKKAGAIDRNTLLAQNIITADLENFDFDAKFTIIEFTVSAIKDGRTIDIVSNSNKITNEQKDLIKGLKAEDRVLFYNIKATGPDGQIRKLYDLVLNLEN